MHRNGRVMADGFDRKIIGHRSNGTGEPFVSRNIEEGQTQMARLRHEAEGDNPVTTLLRWEASISAKTGEVADEVEEFGLLE